MKHFRLDYGDLININRNQNRTKIATDMAKTNGMDKVKNAAQKNSNGGRDRLKERTASNCFRSTAYWISNGSAEKVETTKEWHGISETIVSGCDWICLFVWFFVSELNKSESNIDFPFDSAMVIQWWQTRLLLHFGLILFSSFSHCYGVTVTEEWVWVPSKRQLMVIIQTDKLTKLRLWTTETSMMVVAKSLRLINFNDIKCDLHQKLGQVSCCIENQPFSWQLIGLLLI